MRNRLSIGILALGLALPAATAQAQVVWHGFAEQAVGVRLQEDTTKHDGYNMLEQRLQLKTRYVFKGDNLLGAWQSWVSWKADLTADWYFGGKTDFDLREFFWSASPVSWCDVKAGRQVLTWGTGDYLFINDVFPKDYVSFFIGRDDEYLKKPSDAVRFSFYPSFASVDFVVIPVFEPNTIPKGDRLSFFDSFQGGVAGLASDRKLTGPGLRPGNFEYALRVYRPVGSAEAAVYAARGFDKMPRSYLNEAARELFYERQDVYGGSWRGPVLGGIGSVEFGYVRSPQDARGDNRLIANSMVKAMAGFEKDLGSDWKVGFQYYYEETLDYGPYRDALLPQDFSWPRRRHVVTNRITKLFKNQTVRVTLFTFYSPSDGDGYARPSVTYDITDRWQLTVGASAPWGDDGTSEFGQFAKNKNVFMRVRYNF
ncbi:MAG: hypothetical protein ACM3L6_04790 [Deltaproteobacteria bacterium]